MILQPVFQGTEINSVELIVNVGNAYDAFDLWKRRAELLQALRLEKAEFQRADLTLLLSGYSIKKPQLFDSTHRLDR